MTGTLLSGWMDGWPFADVRGPSKTSQAYNCAHRTDEHGAGKAPHWVETEEELALTIEASAQCWLLVVQVWLANAIPKTMEATQASAICSHGSRIAINAQFK